MTPPAAQVIARFPGLLTVVADAERKA